MKEKEKILREMINKGYYLKEEDINRFCEMFTLEQIQMFQHKFIKYKNK